MRKTTLSTRSRSGFTLMEVMVSLAILAIGLTAVAALFPAAIVLQREAVNETMQQQYTRSTEGLLIGKGVSSAKLWAFTEFIRTGAATTSIEKNPAYDVYPLASVDTDPLTSGEPQLVPPFNYGDQSYLANWSVMDRSFPSIIPDPALRASYWVPLYRRGVEANEYINDWRVYVFIMEPAPGAVYRSDWSNTPSGPDRWCANPWDPDYFPKVFRVEISKVNGNVILFDNTFSGAAGVPGSVPELIKAGDMVLGDNGIIYRVADADGAGITVTQEVRYNPETNRPLKAIWYAQPHALGERSPVRDIRLLSNDVVRMDPLP